MLTFTRAADSQTDIHVAKMTATGVNSGYDVALPEGGGSTWTNTYPDGTQSVTKMGADGSKTNTSPDGTRTTYMPGPDPRFGMQVPLTQFTTMTTPSGLSRTSSTSRTVTLSDPNNPLSVTTETDTTTTNGNAVTSSYSAATATWTTTLAASNQRTSTAVLDSRDHVVQSQVGDLLPVNTTYDAHGHPGTLSQGTRTVSMSYGSDGLLSSFTDPLTKTTQITRDLVGRPIAWTLPDGRVIQMSYDVDGNVTSVTPPGRPAHTMSYTPVDALATYTPPDVAGQPVATTTYTYNLAQQVVEADLPDGQVIQYGYDAAGRRSSVTYPYDEVGFTYNQTTGHLASVATPSESLSFSNDGPLMTGMQWSGAISGSVAYAYDSQFRITSDAVNGASAIVRTYDADGLLTGVGAMTIARAQATGLVTATALGTVTDAFTYDGFGAPVTYNALAGTAPIYTVSYLRDALGRITVKTETNGGATSAWGYTYDTTGRLIDVTLNGAAYAQYVYDANGNRLQRITPSNTESGTYDDQDRVLTYNGASYTFTAAGTLATKTDVTGMTSYAYDALGNLRHVAVSSGAVIDYVIDGQNRRVGKKVNGILIQGFLYGRRLGPVAELDGNGNVVSRFVYARRSNVPEYMSRNGETYRLVKDQLGSPRAIVNQATGEVAQRIDYDEYGRVLNDTSAGFQPFGFAGGILDQDVGFVRLGARDYDPNTATWLTRDPLRFAGGDANLYRYAIGDGINQSDPSGMTVYECYDRRNNFWWSNVTGYDHVFLKTDAYPGGWGVEPIPDWWWGFKAVGTDHTGTYDDEPNVDCVSQPHEDEACVNDQINASKNGLGAYIPVLNDCESWASQTVQYCEGAN